MCTAIADVDLLSTPLKVLEHTPVTGSWMTLAKTVFRLSESSGFGFAESEPKTQVLPDRGV